MVIALLSDGDLVVRAVAGAAPATCSAAGCRSTARSCRRPPAASTATSVWPARRPGCGVRSRARSARPPGCWSRCATATRPSACSPRSTASDGDGGFSADEERLLEAFAASAATAVVTAQRVAASTLRRRVEAAEHERARWARELHDESLQDLAGLKILLASGRRGAADDRLAATVDEAISRLSQSIEGLRGLIADLRPAALDQLGVTAALEGLAERTRIDDRTATSSCRSTLDETRLGARRREHGLPSRPGGTDERRQARRRLAADVARHDEPTRPSTSRCATTARGFDPGAPGGGLRARRACASASSSPAGACASRRRPGAGTIVRAHIPLDPDGDRPAATGSAA